MSEPACGASIQYCGGPRFECVLPAGHHGTHYCPGEVTPVTWTTQVALTSSGSFP